MKAAALPSVRARGQAHRTGCHGSGAHEEDDPVTGETLASPLGGSGQRGAGEPSSRTERARRCALTVAGREPRKERAPAREVGRSEGRPKPRPMEARESEGRIGASVRPSRGHLSCTGRRCTSRGTSFLVARKASSTCRELVTSRRMRGRRSVCGATRHPSPSIGVCRARSREAPALQNCPARERPEHGQLLHRADPFEIVAVQVPGRHR